jgi:hypothetical protein
MNQDADEPTAEAFSALPQGQAFDDGQAPAPTPPPVMDRDQILTPRSLPPIERPARAQAGCGMRLALAAGLAMSLLALLLSSLLLVRLWRVGRTAGAMLDRTIVQLERLCGPSSEPIVFPFSQTIHFQGDFALPEGLVFPFKGTIPINTVVRLTIPGLPGSPTVELPIRTEVPVDTRVPVPGGLSVPIDTEIPINQEIPLDLCATGSPAKVFLEGAISDLKTLRSSFSFP